MKTRAGRLAAAFLALACFAGAAPAQSAPRSERAVLAGGCFWGMQDVFEHVRGVKKVVVGFSGGNALTAHYEVVSSGMTGHAESAEITFDPAQVSYATLLDIFFTVAHDPTTLDRQGPDSGTQYRSAIFYADAAQKAQAQDEIRKLTASHVFGAPIVTQVVPLGAFYPAEAYHQHYADLHPDDGYITYNDAPKVKALQAKFASRYTANPAS